ncbi:MAG: 50S ribosomal protein L5 [Candidatus Calescibacterium sp.]|nr:50S ribosomal protein L5 [Candidatus Calescibacterium sp.]MCX7972712.1 50S ribosomal protein L5 [bacterium]MDW8195516.1 50S ribosomal protein L5 [Candidatus Calescibacterium sp.]
MLKTQELRLYQKYKQEVVPELMKIFNYKSIMQVPRIEKVVVNMGVGDATQNQDVIKKVQKQLMLITGQAPVIIKAKKSISNFKLRKGMNIGLKVTLRKALMWAFLDKLISIVLPRIRDFKGISSNSFDGRGNYNLGIKEQIIFPELSYDDIDKVRGMDINITTTAKTDKEAYELLRLLGFPFKK